MGNCWTCSHAAYTSMGSEIRTVPHRVDPIRYTVTGTPSSPHSSAFGCNLASTESSREPSRWLREYTSGIKLLYQ
jgi:hypothetical protein